MGACLCRRSPRLSASASGEQAAISLISFCYCGSARDLREHGGAAERLRQLEVGPRRQLPPAPHPQFPAKTWEREWAWGREWSRGVQGHQVAGASSCRNIRSRRSIKQQSAARKPVLHNKPTKRAYLANMYIYMLYMSIHISGITEQNLAQKPWVLAARTGARVSWRVWLTPWYIHRCRYTSMYIHILCGCG